MRKLLLLLSLLIAGTSTVNAQTFVQKRNGQSTTVSWQYTYFPTVPNYSPISFRVKSSGNSNGPFNTIVYTTTDLAVRSAAFPASFPYGNYTYYVVSVVYSLNEERLGSPVVTVQRTKKRFFGLF